VRPLIVCEEGSNRSGLVGTVRSPGLDRLQSVVTSALSHLDSNFDFLSIDLDGNQ
jgi:hypothetical protein